MVVRKWLELGLNICSKRHWPTLKLTPSHYHQRPPGPCCRYQPSLYQRWYSRRCHVDGREHDLSAHDFCVGVDQCVSSSLALPVTPR